MQRALMKPIVLILVACVVASCAIIITAPLGVESVQSASFTQVKCTNSPVKIRACPHVNCPVLFAYPDNVPVFAAGTVSCGVNEESEYLDLFQHYDSRPQRFHSTAGTQNTPLASL